MRDAPERLLSLAIAGWDPIDGARRFTKLTSMSERRNEFVSRVEALAAQVSPRAQPGSVQMSGYADTYERLFQDLPSITTLIENDVPLTFAVGRDDPYREPVAAAADALGVDLVESSGDHISAFFDPHYADALIHWISN